jgi:hypothetical protein
VSNKVKKKKCERGTEKGEERWEIELIHLSRQNYKLSFKRRFSEFRSQLVAFVGALGTLSFLSSLLLHPFCFSIDINTTPQANRSTYNDRKRRSHVNSSQAILSCHDQLLPFASSLLFFFVD